MRVSMQFGTGCRATGPIAAALGCVLAAGVLAVGGAVAAPAPARADDCPNVEVIFARGTNDTPGLGRVGDAFAADLRRKIGGRTLDTYAVAYPASYDVLTAVDGANDASSRIQDMAGRCPDTRLVLGGYSQGAAVVDLLGALPNPTFGFTNPLPPDAEAHIAAVAVFGNPSSKLGLPLTASPLWGGKAIDLCTGGDPVCQVDGTNVDSHVSYSGSEAERAADFVAGRL